MQLSSETSQPAPPTDSATQRRWQQMGTCYYVMHQYPRWEMFQKKRGLPPARDIEKVLQWDGRSDDSGKGYQVITSFLESKRTKSDTANQVK